MDANITACMSSAWRTHLVGAISISGAGGTARYQRAETLQLETHRANSRTHLVMPPSSNPAVVICHGLYHSPALYLPLITALQAVGIEAYCPQLPTSDLTKLNVGNVDHPSFDLGPPKGGYPQGEQEIETINGVLKPLLAQGKSIILLGHSAGGWTATQAAKKEFQAKERARQDLAGGIVGILYVGAFIIPVGESVNSFFQPEDGAAVVPPFMKFHVSFLDVLLLGVH
jgi:pimeloyl-ACP methyl ester carboxylesterase